MIFVLPLLPWAQSRFDGTWKADLSKLKFPWVSVSMYPRTDCRISESKCHLEAGPLRGRGPASRLLAYLGQLLPRALSALNEGVMGILARKSHVNACLHYIPAE
jgi:hypothetical protein